MDILTGYQIRVSVPMERSEMSGWLTQVMVANAVRVTVDFRQFDFITSTFDYRLQVYPGGLSDFPIDLAPEEANYSEHDALGGVRSLRLNYHLPEALRARLTERSEILSVSRLSLGGAGEAGANMQRYTPVDSLHGEARYLAARQPAVWVSGNCDPHLVTGPCAMDETQLYGRGRMAGTLKEITDPKAWGDKRP